MAECQWLVLDDYKKFDFLKRMKAQYILILSTVLACSRPVADIPDKYQSDKTVDRILVIHHKENSKASARLYAKTGNSWEMIIQCSATIGREGVGKDREGDWKTPVGDFEVTGAFGIKPNPGTSLPYIDITPSTFACDEECPYYNTIIDTAVVHHDCKGEAMYNISPQYSYGLIIDYNPTREYPKGSAIFIHCTGTKPYTAGCVSLSPTNLIKIMKEAHPGMRVIID